MDITFTVSSVNAGPAPFDVVADNGGIELRLRFHTDDPAVEVGTQIAVSYTPVEKPEPPAEPALPDDA